MTLKERVIVETYTGICMTSADENNEIYKYMEELLGRPVYTHELASKEVQEQIKKKALPDFKALCITEQKWDEAKKNAWQPVASYLKDGRVYYAAKKAADLMERYNNGERTAELYEAMIEA